MFSYGSNTMNKLDTTQRLAQYNKSGSKIKITIVSSNQKKSNNKKSNNKLINNSQNASKIKLNSNYLSVY
jgi:hypothetical protein